MPLPIPNRHAELLGLSIPALHIPCAYIAPSPRPPGLRSRPRSHVFTRGPSYIRFVPLISKLPRSDGSAIVFSLYVGFLWLNSSDGYAVTWVRSVGVAPLINTSLPFAAIASVSPAAD